MRRRRGRESSTNLNPEDATACGNVLSSRAIFAVRACRWRRTRRALYLPIGTTISPQSGQPGAAMAGDAGSGATGGATGEARVL